MKISLGDEDTKDSREDFFIKNSKPDCLISHVFQQGQYFHVVSCDGDGFEIKISSRIMFKVAYIKEKDDITQFELIKLDNGKEKQKLTLSSFGFSKMIAFLDFITKIDLKGITERTIKLADSELDDINPEDRKKIMTFLSKGDDGIKIIEEFLNSGAITSKDIVNIGYRKAQLEIFQKQLAESLWEEKEWQDFFKNNQWIFGYGLRYQFLSLITDQPSYEGSNYSGSGEQRGDYLMNSEAEKKFTVLVEIKKPQTKLVGQKQYRSGVWKLGEELLWATSQTQINCISWFRDGSRKDTAIDDLDQNQIYTYQPKGILVIGHTSQLDNRDKRQTFEVYRRELHNPEIITFDELYERARYIVEHGMTDKPTEQGFENLSLSEA